MKNYSFTQKDKLLKKWQFIRVYENGKKFVGNLLVAYVLQVDATEKKIGITSSKKVGKAHLRNRVRRLIRESYRLMQHDLKPGFNIVFVARGKATHKDIGLRDIDMEIKMLLKRALIYEGSS